MFNSTEIWGSLRDPQPLLKPVSLCASCLWVQNQLDTVQTRVSGTQWVRDKEVWGLWVQDQGQCPPVHQACRKCSGPLSAGSWLHCWEIRIWVDTQTISILIRNPRRGTLYSCFSGKRTGNLMVWRQEEEDERSGTLESRPQRQEPCWIFLFYLMSSHPSPMM